MIKELIDIVYPKRCPACDDIIMPKGNKICYKCKDIFTKVSEPRCKKCNKTILNSEDEYCYDCKKKNFSYKYGKSLWEYDKNMRKSMAGFKYKGRAEYSDYYVEELIKYLKSDIYQMNPDVLIPVPIHKSRLKSRGYNQAEIIARGLEKSLNIPVRTDIIKRKKNTLPQKELNDKQRKKNLLEAFEIDKNFASNNEKIKRVLLIDDIYTTGSTIEACTQILLSNNIGQVYFITLCIGNGY